MIGLVIDGDHPKMKTVVRTVNEETEWNLGTPVYSVTAVHRFHNTYGFNRYTVSFCDELRKYSEYYDYDRKKPEKLAKEVAQHSQTQLSDELVEDIKVELMGYRYYISDMDVKLAEGKYTMVFSNPLRFSRIDSSNEELQLIVTRVRELVNNQVKSVDEVLNSC